MSAEEYKHYVPQTLDDPPKLLFWDMDVAMVFIVMLGFAIMVGQMVIGTIAGLILAAMFARANKARGYGRVKHPVSAPRQS